jgi:hypothetical protein
VGQGEPQERDPTPVGPSGTRRLTVTASVGLRLDSSMRRRLPTRTVSRTGTAVTSATFAAVANRARRPASDGAAWHRVMEHPASRTGPRRSASSQNAAPGPFARAHTAPHPVDGALNNKPRPQHRPLPGERGTGVTDSPASLGSRSGSVDLSSPVARRTSAEAPLGALPHDATAPTFWRR